MMRQLTIFIILFIHFGLFAQTPELIFHSGFEPNVDTSGHNSANLDIIGSDNSMPFYDDWVDDLEFHPNIGEFEVQFQGGTALQRMAEIVPDPVFPANHVLQFWVKEPNSDNNGRVQANLYNNDNLYNVYYSIRLYLPEVFNLLKTMPTSVDNDMITLMEFWNNNSWEPEEGNYYKVKVNLTKNGNFEDSVRVKVSGQGIEDIWQFTNTSFVVPVKKWMTLKVYFVEGDDCTGRFIMTITPDGSAETIVHNVRNFTHHPDNPAPDGLRDFNPFKLYTSDDVVYWVRDYNQFLNLYWDDFVLLKDPVLPTVDECLTGGITFSTQSQINSFASDYPGCKYISGDVTISGGAITSLAGLSQITSIDGALIIQSNNSITSLSGLGNLTCLDGDLIIDSNSSLTNISALNKLRSLNGNLQISNNASLPNLTGLHHIAEIDGSLTISNNGILASLTGLESIKNTTFDSLFIQNNINLFFCELDNICKYLENNMGPVNISGNDAGCNTQQEVELACLILLPVELTHFSGKEVEGEVLLSWQTASEVSNDYFQVEHSVDGRDFNPIGEINGHGTTSEENDYLFTHKQPGPGLNYYRLKQVDYDGAYTYSFVIAIDIEVEDIVIRPNPTSNQVEIIGENLAGSFVKVMDSMGRVVVTLELTDSNTINLSDQPRGIYIFIFQTTGQSTVKRIVKN